MNQDDPRRYNYETFVDENFQAHDRFEESPVLGKLAPDFPLWKLDDRSVSSLKEAWQGSSFLVVEFGSFT